jgi:hypothetical protein
MMAKTIEYVIRMNVTVNVEKLGDSGVDAVERYLRAVIEVGDGDDDHDILSDIIIEAETVEDQRA